MKFSWTAFLTIIAGGGLTAIGAAVAALLPDQKIAALVTGIVGIIGLVAGLILQSMQPVNKLTDNAKAYNAQGQVTGENVTTTTTAPIAAQTKGP